MQRFHPSFFFAKFIYKSNTIIPPRIKIMPKSLLRPILSFKNMLLRSITNAYEIVPVTGTYLYATYLIAYILIIVVKNNMPYDVKTLQLINSKTGCLCLRMELVLSNICEHAAHKPENMTINKAADLLTFHHHRYPYKNECRSYHVKQSYFFIEKQTGPKQ